MSRIDQIAALFGTDAALDLMAGLCAKDWPDAEVVVVSFCEAAQPKFHAEPMARAEAMALAPSIACALACEPCGRGRHVVEITCDGTDHGAWARLRTIDPSEYTSIAPEASS